MVVPILCKSPGFGFRTHGAGGEEGVFAGLDRVSRPERGGHRGKFEEEDCARFLSKEGVGWLAGALLKLVEEERFNGDVGGRIGEGGSRWRDHLGSVVVAVCSNNSSCFAHTEIERGFFVSRRGERGLTGGM